MSSWHDTLLQRIEDHSAHTAVIGLGYVGLPSAVLHARAGYDVSGIESDPNRVAAVSEGVSYIEEVSNDALVEAVRSGQLRATSEFQCIAEADVVSICVPTPLNARRDPNVSFIHHVLDQGRQYWRPGQLVILESTTYPGTTDEILVPFFSSLGFTVGEDFFVAFAPERIDPGNSEYGLSEIPRVVGGATPRCVAAAAAFYRQVLDARVTTVSSLHVAEMTKLFENVFRLVNISLVNELAQLCDRMQIDVWEVIEAAKTKPFGFMPFYPGPGIGGECIPVDPFYLSWKARELGFQARFVDLAGEINDGMPLYVVEHAAELLKERSLAVRGARVLLLGMAFKKNVADTRLSPALAVAEQLVARGAKVSYHDPHVPSVSVAGRQLSTVPLSADLLRASDLVIITTDHARVDYPLVVEASPLIYDARNALAAFTLPNIRCLGAPARHEGGTR